MLKKENRIKKKNDFALIFKNGKNLKAGFFILKVLNNNLQLSRLAIIISQKVSKKAVERNRLRRLISSIFEENFKQLQTGFDFVFLVLPNIKDKDNLEIKAKVVEVFKNYIIKNK